MPTGLAVSLPSPVATAVTPPVDSVVDAAAEDIELDELRVLYNVPPHLHDIVRSLRALPEQDQKHLATLSAVRVVRERLLPTATSAVSWYLPTLAPVPPGEPRWCLPRVDDGALVVTCAGQRLRLAPLVLLTRAALGALIWFALWNILPHALMERGGVVFDPFIVVCFSALIGGTIARMLRLPPIVGVLGCAILAHNVPRVGYFTAGMVPTQRTIVLSIGLSMILSRAGFAMNMALLRATGKYAVGMAVLPMSLEAIVHGLIATSVFSYDGDYRWGMLQGFTCAVISTAVTLPTAFQLQEQGLGVGKNSPLNLIYASIGLETVCGVWTVNFINSLLFNKSLSVGLLVALGPIQFIGGALAGFVLGCAFYKFVQFRTQHAPRVADHELAQRAEWFMHDALDEAYVVFLCVAHSAVFLSKYLGLSAGGAACVVAFAATVSHFWSHDEERAPTAADATEPRLAVWTAKRRELARQRAYFNARLAQTWDLIAAPLLFAYVGSIVDVGTIFSAEFFPKALACTCAAAGTRMVVSFLVQTGSGATWREKLVVTLGHNAKATVQASLMSLALSNGLEGEDLRRGIAIQQMAALTIIFWAPIGGASMMLLGPWGLKKNAV